MILGNRSFSVIIGSLSNILGMGGDGEEVEDCACKEMIVTE